MRGMSSSLALCLIWQASVSANQSIDIGQILANGYSPNGLAVSGDGSTYIGASKANVNTDAIFRFGPSGELQSVFPPPEAPPEAQLASITRLDVDALGRIHAYDGIRQEFKLYDGGGTFLSKWPLPPGTSPILGMAAGPRGELSLLTGDSVRVYDAAGTPLRTFGQGGPSGSLLLHPRAIDVDSEGYTYVAHMDDEKIFVGGAGLMAYENLRSVKVFNPLGEFVRSFSVGSTPPNRDLATSITTVGDRVIVTDGVSGMLQRYSRDGTLEATAYGIPAVRQMAAASDGHMRFLQRQVEGFVQDLTSAEFDSRRVGVSSYFDHVRFEYQQWVLDEAGIGRHNTAAETFAQTFLEPVSKPS